MSHPHPGTLATYNSLTDKHLVAYFSNTRIRRQLQRSGLITKSGRILSEKEYQLNAMKKDHQKYIRECLAQAIFHKVLDMEHRHQVELKRKLETTIRKERIQRIKVEQSRRSAEDPLIFLSPRPPTAPKNRVGRYRLCDRGQLGRSGERCVFRPMNPIDFATAISPYRLPIINNYVIPVPPPPPPPPPKNDKNINMKYGTCRGRRFRPTTAPNCLDQTIAKDTGKFYKPQIHSNAYVSMIYLGKSVHLCHDVFDYRDEIKIYQQHCGGENVCVFKGKLLEGETFQFTSRRHHGFPFSLTFYLNGIQVDRLSSCCEYKHRRGTRLGGKHGHFGFVNVERSSPCYRCIIAMGLDKQPCPPKRKVTDEYEEKKEDSCKDDTNHKLSETSSGVGCRKVHKDVPSSPSSPFPTAAGGRKECEKMEVEATKEEIKSDECERNRSSTSDNAYDEDFEADELKSDEKVNEEGQADDQMNGMSKSPSDDEKDNLDHETASKNSSQKALQASDSERDESDGYSESDLEEDKQGIKHEPSISPSSILYSSDNDSEGNSRKQDDEKENTDIHTDYENEVIETQREESQETEVEEEVGETDDTEVKNVPDHKESMEMDFHDMPIVSEELTLVGLVDTREDRDDEPLEEEHRSKESSEDEREGDQKSVQEKIAEAFENEPPWSSEPELSDSSTEDEEEDVTATQDKHEVPDEVSLADEDLMKHRSQIVEEPEEQEIQMVGKDIEQEEEEIVDDDISNEIALEEEIPPKNVATIVPELNIKRDFVTEETEPEAEEEELDLEMDHIEEKITYEKEKLCCLEEEMKGEEEEPLFDSEEEMKREENLHDSEEEMKGEENVCDSEKEMKGEENVCDSEEEMKGEENLCDSEEEMKGDENLCDSEDEMEEKELLCVSEDEVEELEGTASSDVICEREDIFYWSQLQWEQVENPNFSEESLVIGKVCEVQEEVDVAAEMIRTRELVEKKIMLEEAFEAMEVVKEIVEADEVLGMTFVPGDSSEDLLTTVEEESETRELEAEAVDGEIFCDGFIMENETTEIMFWKKDEHFEEEKYMKTELNNASDMKIDPTISSSKETADGTADFFIFIDEKASASEDAIDGGNSFKEVPCGVEKIVQKFPLICEEELEKTLPQASEMKNVGLEEDSEQEEVKSWVGEPPLDWATEGNISVMKKNYQAQTIITEEAKSFDKLITREEVIKAMVKANERAQEEESLVKALEEDIGDTEEMSIFEETVPEWKQKLFSEEPFKTIPEAFALVAGRAETEDNLDVEEAEREVKGELEDEEIEREGSVNGEVCAAEVIGNVTLKWGIDEEAEGQMADEEEAAETESEEAVNREVDFGVVLGNMAFKREVDIDYPEGDMAVEGEVEYDETECEVAVKGKVGDEEEEKGEVDKWELDVDEAERLATVEEEVEAVDSEREVVVSGEVDAEVIGNVLDIEEAESDMAVEGEVEDEDLRTEREATYVDIGSEGEMVSEVKCRENVVNTLRARLEEAKLIPELSAQELALERGRLTQLMRMMNEQAIQDKIGKSSEASVVGKTSMDSDSDFDLLIKKSSATDFSIDDEESINMLMKKENIPVEKEKENETCTEEPTIDGVVPLQIVEEALLIGIQQLITDVSQLSVGVDNEEEEELESLVEESSSHENPVKEELLADVVAKERTTAQADEADVKGTELGKEIYFEEKYQRGNEEIETGDNSVESLLEVETIPWSTQQSGTEQQQDSSAQISNQESAEMSDLQDEH